MLLITADVISCVLTVSLAFHSSPGDGTEPPQQRTGGDNDHNWNFTQWWFERNEYSQVVSEPVVFQEPPNAVQYSDLDKFDTVHYGVFNDSSIVDGVVVTSSPILIENNGTPATSILRLNDTLLQFFMTSRHWNDDKDYMRDLREALKEKFLSYGLKTAFHIFKAEDSPMKLPLYPGAVKRQTACNIIAILPGQYRGTPEDEILLIGAHYDTVKKSPGVDDNGSGSAAVLEIARLLSTHRCRLNKTVIFTLFDLEEEYLKGSKYFVQQYLIPTELNKNKAKFKGAYIMDMLLSYNTTNGSQSLRDFWSTLPMFVEEVKESGAKGNFLTAWSRRNIDQDLYFFLEKNWKNHNYPLRLLDPPLPTWSHEVAKNWTRYSKYGTFARSDHASFWYPIDRDKTFNAVLLSDLGPWRKDMLFHYHRPSDDMRWLRRENLEFMKNTVDSLVATIIDLGQGKCWIKKH